MTARAVARHAGVATIVAAALYAALVGLDFGHHWDEIGHAQMVAEAVVEGRLYPEWYSYSSFCFDLNMVHASVTGVTKGIRAHAALGAMPALEAAIGVQAFLLRCRAVFIVYTMLGAVWVYLAVLRAGRSRIEATFAAGVLGLSWQLGYHARWVAPDAVLASTAALTALCLETALARRSARWVLGAAAAAGVACSTKYPSGLLLVPVLACAWVVAGGRRRLGRTSWQLACAVVVFAVSYLVVTPGTLVDRERFTAHVLREYDHYHAVGHTAAHNVEPGAQHLRASLEFLFWAAPSRDGSIGALLGALAVLGAFAMLRESVAKAVVRLAFPVAYVVFMSEQKVFIVRNLLVVLPFVAILAARGAARVAQVARAVRGGPWVVVGAAAALLVVNGARLVKAGQSIALRVDPVADVADYITGHRSARFGVTAQVAGRIRQRLGALPANVVSAKGAQQVDLVVFDAHQAAYSRYVATHHDTAFATFGTDEVDYAYYPDWDGNDRIVAVTPDVAHDLGIVAP